MKSTSLRECARGEAHRFPGMQKRTVEPSATMVPLTPPSVKLTNDLLNVAEEPSAVRGAAHSGCFTSSPVSMCTFGTPESYGATNAGGRVSMHARDRTRSEKGPCSGCGVAQDTAVRTRRTPLRHVPRRDTRHGAVEVSRDGGHKSAAARGRGSCLHVKRQL